jgi:hypothetical protein
MPLAQKILQRLQAGPVSGTEGKNWHRPAIDPLKVGKQCGSFVQITLIDDNEGLQLCHPRRNYCPVDKTGRRVECHHYAEHIQVGRNQVDTAAGITPAQFRPARQPLQQLASYRHGIADHMAGIPFDPDHAAISARKNNLDLDTMMGSDQTGA